MGIKLKNVKQIRGKTYYAYKVNGRVKYISLPAPHTPDFLTAYVAASNSAANDRKPVELYPADSFHILIERYRSSPGFAKALSKSTQDNYEIYLGMIDEKIGKMPVRLFSRRMAVDMRDQLQDKPGTANNLLKVAKTILNFACEIDWIKENAARDVKPLEIGEHEPWPQEVIDAFLESATPMTRLAAITGLYSGQRISDVIRMRYDWIDGDGYMSLTQQKTGKFVYIPMHPEWLTELKRLPRRADTLIYTRSGKPFGSTSALQDQVRATMKRIGATGYSFHGLRKNSTNYLAEMGLTPHQIGAINGMSIETVIHYTHKVGVRSLSRSAAEQVLAGDVRRGLTLASTGEEKRDNSGESEGIILE